MSVSARALSRGSSPRAGSGIADAAHGRLDAGLGQALAVLDRHILHAAVGVVDPTRAAERPAGGKCLLQRVGHKASLRRAADPPGRAGPPAGPTRPGGCVGRRRRAPRTTKQHTSKATPLITTTA